MLSSIVSHVWHQLSTASMCVSLRAGRHTKTAESCYALQVDTSKMEHDVQQDVA